MLEQGGHDEAGCVDRRQRAFIAHEDLAPLEARLDRADRSRSGHLEKGNAPWLR